MELTEQDKARLAEVRREHPALAAFVDEVREEMGAKVVWLKVRGWEIGRRGPDGVIPAPEWQVSKEKRCPE